MRKLLLVTAALALILSGCTSRPYEIVKEDGDCYLVFESLPPEDQEICCTFAPLVVFDSLAEMKSDILTGDFAEDEMEDIYRFRRDDAGRIKTIDLDAMHQAVFPDSLEVKYVTWYGGNSYEHLFESPDGGPDASMTRTSKEDWDEQVDLCANFAQRRADKIKVISQTTEADRNAQVLRYKTSANVIVTKKYYTIEQGDDILHIEESHSEKTDGDISESITVLGFTNGYYFHTTIHMPDYEPFAERPSVEWLSEFAMKDYEEEPSWLIPVGLGCAVLVVGAGVGIAVHHRKKRNNSTPASAEEGAHDEQ